MRAANSTPGPAALDFDPAEARWRPRAARSTPAPVALEPDPAGVYWLAGAGRSTPERGRPEPASAEVHSRAGAGRLSLPAAAPGPDPAGVRCSVAAAYSTPARAAPRRRWPGCGAGRGRRGRGLVRRRGFSKCEDRFAVDRRLRALRLDLNQLPILRRSPDVVLQIFVQRLARGHPVLGRFSAKGAAKK